MSLISLILTSSTALAADCQPTSALVLQRLLDGALDAYEARDKDGYLERMDAAEAALPCLTEPVTAGLAASVHRGMGLQAFLVRDQQAAELSFAAARSLQPAYSFPSTLVPAHHPVLEMYLALDPASGSQVVLVPPSRGQLLLDGHHGGERSSAFPQIVQYLSGQGEVVWTAYVQPDQAPPDYPVGSYDAGLPELLDAQPHEDRQVWLYVEADVGIAKGGLDRIADERVKVDEDGAVVGRSYVDGLSTRQSARGGLALGMRLGRVVDLGVRGDAYVASQQWTTGWTLADGSSDLRTMEPRPSWVLQVEPRMRLTFNATDLAGFYWLTGAGLTYLPAVDGIEAAPYGFSSRPARTIFGVTVGAGAMWHLSEKTSLFVEIPWTLYLLGHQVQASEDSSVYPGPSSISSTTNWIYSGTLGLQRRF